MSDNSHIDNRILKAVQIGCGGMGNGWVENALKTEGLQIVGLVDLHRPAAEKTAEKFKLPGSIVFDSLAEVLAVTSADVVFDVTVPAAHEAVAIEALRAGRHVLGEKPMSDSLESAKRMVAAAKSAGKTYAVTQNYRYVPQIRQFKQLIASAQLGGIEELHADMLLGPRFGGFREEMDYPLILDMSIHTFDAARFLTGADPVSVYCHSFNPKRSWYKGDASAVAVFEFTGGIVFSYRGSWCAEGLDMPFSSRWRAVCGNGSVTWDGEKAIAAQAVRQDGKHGFFREKVDVPVPEIEMPRTGHGALMEEFVACLREGRKPETGCEDNIKSLAMVFAAVESARSGTKVAVKW